MKLGEKLKSSGQWLRLLGLLIFAFILYKVDWSGLLAVVREMKGCYLLLAALLIFPLLLLKSYRWYLLLRIQGLQYDFGLVCVDFVNGNYVGLITPGRLGELVRVAYLKEAAHTSYGQALSNVLFDRLLDLGLTMTVGLVGLLVYRPSEVLTALAVAALLPIAGVLAFVLFNRRSLEELLSRFYRLLVKQREEDIRTFLRDFYAGLAQFWHVRLVFPLLVSIAAYSCIILQGYLLTLTAGFSVAVPYLAFCISTVVLASLLPFSISGVGIREATLIALLGAQNITAAHSLTFSLLFLAVSNLSGALIGLVGWHWRLSAERAKSTAYIWRKDRR